MLALTRGIYVRSATVHGRPFDYGLIGLKFLAVAKGSDENEPTLAPCNQTFGRQWSRDNDLYPGLISCQFSRIAVYDRIFYTRYTGGMLGLDNTTGTSSCSNWETDYSVYRVTVFRLVGNKLILLAILLIGTRDLRVWFTAERIVSECHVPPCILGKNRA